MGRSYSKKTNENKVVIRFFKENIFSRFRTPRAIISDNGTHFCNRSFEAFMQKYAITHKLSTPYHSQTSGHVEVSNLQIMLFLEKTVKQNQNDWSIKLVDARMSLQDRIQDDSRDVSL